MGKMNPITNISSKYAVVELGGAHKIVEVGRYYVCNRINADVGSKIQLGRVLAAKENDKFHIGTPWLHGATIEAEILENFKGDKKIIYKMRAKKHSRTKVGHRQLLTRFLVTKIAF